MAASPTFDRCKKAETNGNERCNLLAEIANKI